MKRLLLAAFALVVLLPVGSSAQQAPHCKHPDHLGVLASNGGTDPAAASYIADMHCTNDPSYHGWGVLVGIRPNRPDRGLHLFPDSAGWLPNRLRVEAWAQGDSVTVLHAIGGRLETFAELSDATALALADQIDAATP